MPKKAYVTHDPADPKFPHGLPRGFHRGCTCTPCRKAATRQRDLTRYKGSPHSLVPIGPVREHVQRLLEHPHVNYTTIANATGLTPQGVAYIITDHNKQYVAAQTARYILATTPADVTPEFVDPARSLQRLQSLAANGWNAASVAELMGVSAYTLLPSTLRARTTVAKARLIEQAYKQIGDQPGPSRITAGRARAKGWYPPIFYDDDGNLIREAIPGHWCDEARRAAVTATAVRRAQMRFNVLRHLISTDLSWTSHAAAAERSGYTTKTVERVVREANINPDSDPARLRRCRDAVLQADIAPEDDLPALWETLCADPQPVGNPVDTQPGEDVAA